MKIRFCIFGILALASTIVQASESCEKKALQKLRKAAQQIEGFLLEDSVEQMGIDKDALKAQDEVWYTGQVLQAHHQMKEVTVLAQKTSTGSCL